MARDDHLRLLKLSIVMDTRSYKEEAFPRTLLEGSGRGNGARLNL